MNKSNGDLAQTPAPDRPVFLHAPAGSIAPRVRVGGLPLLERLLREQARAGFTRAVVACDRQELAPDVPIPVEWVAPGSPPPDGMPAIPANVIRGIEVRDEASRRRAEWALVSGMNKSFQGPIDALVNCHFSFRITRALCNTRVMPNHITIAGIFLVAVALGFAAWGGWLAAAIAGVLLQLHSILDSCDGELARLRYQGSRLGQWLDNLSDDFGDDLFVACIGIGLGGPWLWLGLAGALGRALHQTYSYVTVYRATGTGDLYHFRWWFEAAKTSMDEVYDRRSLLTWLRALGRRDTYVFLWMLFCVAGFAEGVVVYGLALAAIFDTMTAIDVVAKARRRADD